MSEKTKSIRELVQKQAKDFPDKPAIIFQDQPVTFSQLRDRVFRLANNLLAHGINKGDKVVMASVGAGMNINAIVYQF